MGSGLVSTSKGPPDVSGSLYAHSVWRKLAFSLPAEIPENSAASQCGFSCDSRSHWPDGHQGPHRRQPRRIAWRSDSTPSLRTVHNARWRHCSDGAHQCKPTSSAAGVVLWSDCCVHPPGDISAISHHSYRSPHHSARSTWLDSKRSTISRPSSPTDPFFNYAGGIRNDDALQPALMHDAAGSARRLGRAWLSFCALGGTRSLPIASTLTRTALIRAPGGRW